MDEEGTNNFVNSKAKSSNFKSFHSDSQSLGKFGISEGIYNPPFGAKP